MLENKLAHLIDGTNAIEIALALGISPGEQAVAAKDQTFGAGILCDGSFELYRELKTGALPR
jgi:hypothetical protein